MKFLSMVRIKEEGARRPSERVMHEMHKLMQDMTKTGALVSTGGLRPTAEGKRMRSTFGKISVQDGPFTETKEVVGGYAILEAPSMEKAMEITRRFLEAHLDEWDVECEVRAFDGPEFGCRGDQ